MQEKKIQKKKTKKKNFFFRFGFFAKKIHLLYSPHPLPTPEKKSVTLAPTPTPFSTPSQQKKRKKNLIFSGFFFTWILCKTNSLPLANPPLPSPPQKESIFFSDLESFENFKKSLTQATPPPLSPPNHQNFFLLD